MNYWDIILISANVSALIIFGKWIYKEEITKEQWLSRKHAKESEISQLKTEIDHLNQ